MKDIEAPSAPPLNAPPTAAEVEKTIKKGSDPLWYKDAIIYQLHIKAFFDSNNDGIGDFVGLATKLDYLQELGVTCIWILPFYPSPLRDDGYDIADYNNVNPTYGTLSDFQFFIQEAHKRGLRVITELVINHTSDQHAWFQRARNAPAGSPERDFYVWSDTDQKFLDARIIFSDTEKSNWTWDPVAKSYYWHRFFSHQPDLNYDNPEVLRQVIEVMYFWLDMGVDGLRLDAVPYLVEREGTSCENLPETHAILRKIRAALEERYPDRMLLAEANQWPEDVLSYFGDGDECHMAFHFPLMPRIYMAVAQEDRHPITDIMQQTPAIPENCQWAVFLRNHDELTLEMVTNRERDYLWNFYAADKRARINFGIRRRLAPLMENDRRKIELLNSLLFSMPGTPIVYYGDEIGMGDNIYLGDRDGVRTPMQWSPDRNGGFSRSDPERLYLAAVMDPIYGYQTVNVETQRRTHYSLFNWMRKLIAAVKEAGIFGRSNLTFLAPSNRAVLAYTHQTEGKTVLCVANLSLSPQAVELDLKDFRGQIPVEMFGRSRFPAIGELPYLLTLAPYGFYWFQLTDQGEDQAQRARTPELFTLVLPADWDRKFNVATLTTLKDKLLSSFLMTRRWYKAKHAARPKVEIRDVIDIGDEFRVLVVEATAMGMEPQTYLMGVGISWDDGADDPLVRFYKDAICKVRRFNRVGVLYEATREEGFLTHILSGFALGQTASADAKLRYEGGDRLPEILTMPMKSLGAEQTNSSAIVGDKYIVKFIHQPATGANLEVELCHHLTDVVKFDRVPKLLGSIELDIGAHTAVVAIVEEAVPNQGDGWQVTLAYLDRQIKQIGLVSDGKREVAAEDTYYILLAEKLGIRTAELHKALEKKTGNKRFDPEPVTAEDRQRWIDDGMVLINRAMENVSQIRHSLSPLVRKKADDFTSSRPKYEELLRALLPETIKSTKTRVHNDFHLGQVLVSDNDFYIIDFEGEPARTPEERERKTSPMKDVAGMLRSFDYAGATALRAASLVGEKDRPEVERFVKGWKQKAEQAFLAGYWGASRTEGGNDARESLLHFFRLEKALYEVVYESQHRPDWLDIPLTSVLEFIKEEGL